MIHIREVHSDDIPVIHAMGEHVDEFHTSDRAPNFWPEAILQGCVGKSDVYFFVATSESDIAGFIIANLNRSLSKTLIENIFVAPGFRGQGIGSSLAQKVAEAAKTDGYQFISALTPPDDAPAIATYEKAGFSRGEIFLWLDTAE